MKSKTHKAKDDGVLGTVVHSIESAFDTVAKKTGLASKPARRRKTGKASKASAKKSRGSAKGKSGARGKSSRSKR